MENGALKEQDTGQASSDGKGENEKGLSSGSSPLKADPRRGSWVPERTQGGLLGHL